MKNSPKKVNQSTKKRILFGKRKHKNSEQDIAVSTLYGGFSKEEKAKYYVHNEPKEALELIAPAGVNTVPLEYMTLNDGGETIYCIGLYIDKLPRYPTFAVTFAPLLHYPGVTSSIFINPLLGSSIKKINKRIEMLDAEMHGAKDDRNRLRQLSGKMNNAEEWAKVIDSGENNLFEVQFLFLLQANSLEKIQMKVSDFQGEARKSGIELSSCYCAHPEAFLSTLPLNRVFKTRVKDGLGVPAIKKKHIMDKKSLATVFNHTNTEFFHENGVCFGRNLYTGMPSCFDPYHKSHLSYGVVIAGKPGYGKSATGKQLLSRMVDFDNTHIAIIDYEPRGKKGEAAAMAEALGGVSFTIASGEGDRLNLFEVVDELEYDIATGKEYPVLPLNDKIVDTTEILLTMAQSANIARNEVGFTAETLARMKTIIMRATKRVYAERGIINGQPASLYEVETMSRQKFLSGRKKKRMPQMRDFYMELLRLHDANNDEFKENAFHLLLDEFEDRIAELYYCPMCLTSFTKEEYDALSRQGNSAVHEHDGKSIAVVEVHGTKAYFDAQSTVELDINLPCIHFDISQAPESERPELMLVCQSFLNEHLIKANSMNPKLASRLIVYIDEAYKQFPYESARRFLNSLYRTARKRHVSPWLIMQSIKDLARYEDTEEILKSTEMYLLFKHSPQDREYIKLLTNITDSQVETILDLGGGDNMEKKRPGELCLIDTPTKQVVFLKADYLVDSEQYIVETDVEILAKMAKAGG